MGLLDGLLGAQGGGLLDFLRNNSLNQQFSGGLASDQAQYSQPPMQAMAQMPPQAAPQSVSQPAPQMPQAAPQAAPQGLPPALGGVGNVLGRIGSPDGLLARLSGNDSKSVSQQNLKAQYDTLVPMLGPQKAMLAVMNPEAGKILIGQALEKKKYGFATLPDGTVVNQDPDSGAVSPAYQGTKPYSFTTLPDGTVVRQDPVKGTVQPAYQGTGALTDDIKEYQFAKKEDPALTFKDFMLRKKSTSGEYSLNPTYAVDTKTGKTVAYQLGKDGKPVKVELPEGTEIAAGTEKIDAGTHFNIYDKKSGQIIGTMPKNVAGKEAEEKVGQARGTAQAALANGADIDAEQTKKKIDELLSNKGFDSIFGSLDQYRPAWTMDAAGKDARTRLDQLKGTAFLSAYSMLKGGGAITDIEGQKAGAAMARLDRSLSEDEARQALNDFKEAVDVGLMKLRRAANGGEVPKAAAKPSGGASVEDLLKKYGQ